MDNEAKPVYPLKFLAYLGEKTSLKERKTKVYAPSKASPAQETCNNGTLNVLRWSKVRASSCDSRVS